MDVPRVKSPPCILVNEPHGQHGYQTTSKTAGMPFLGSRGAMQIPNARDMFPAPLPPPRNPDVYAAGSDLGYHFATKYNDGGASKGGGSVSQGSSLRGNWVSRREVVRMVERKDDRRHENLVTLVKSPADMDTKFDFSRRQDEGYYSPSLETNSANYQLHGARHLEQKNLKNSSQAYDNKLLSKIGRPETPPRSLSIGSIECSPTSSQAFYQGAKPAHRLKCSSTPDESMCASPDLPFRKDSFPSRFGSSPQSRPQSRPISPGLITSAISGKQFMDWRSPTWDSSTPSSAIEWEQHQRRPGSSSHPLRHQRSRRSGSGPMLSSLDESAHGSVPCGNHSAISSNPYNTPNTGQDCSHQYKRGNYDQSMISESDPAVSGNTSEYPVEETGASALRRLHLDDHTPHSSLESFSSSYYLPSVFNSHSSSTESRMGVKKRKAGSPPPGVPHEDKPLLLVGGDCTDYHNRTSSTAQLSANQSSPQNLFAPSHGSISSASSSGLRNGSYASSNGLSLGSSITSISSHDHLSPGGLSPGCISPSSEQQQHQQQGGRDSPYVSTLSLKPDPQDSLSRAQQRPQAESQSTAAIARKMSVPSTPQKHSAAPKIQNHICECCPKKPKKFDTLQELKNHESEKQYVCQFCHNRFKNKNEAERHQNSLHLRRHSWSCATLAGNFDAAFHPQTTMSITSNPNDPPSLDLLPPDICGYCGVEFSNNPPDWETRISHLTNVHKFGECNQSKKFFRADHFRQHLKHSHAGTSGKWTNMLENACMKDEPPITMPEPQIGAPIANMSNMPNMSNMSNMSSMSNMPNMPNMSNMNLSANLSNMPNMQNMSSMPNMAMVPSHGVQANAMNMGMPGMGLGKNERIDEMPQEM